MADQYSGDLIVGLLHKVDDAKVRPVAKPPFHVSPNANVSPGAFTLEIFQYFTVSDWLPFIFFGELQRRTQGSNAKASAVWLE